MIEVLTTTDSQKLLHQLNTLLEQESRCQPKVCGLRLIESAHDNGLRMTARLRDFEVKDLLSLTQFFGFDTETFSLAVNLLDRFLSKMKVQPKHLGCVGLSCFYLAVKSIEEERNVPLATDLIRISQYRFTVSDLMRMEKIVLEKVCWKVKATTAFQFLQLYYSLIQENLPFERLIYLKGRITERQRQREGERGLPSPDSLPRWPQWPELRRSEARSQVLLPGLPGEITLILKDWKLNLRHVTAGSYFLKQSLLCWLCLSLHWRSKHSSVWS
nr:cyclin-G1 isoform X2 [Oryctolagus cuniculus]